MNALVTGGGGFLGRYIVEQLRSRGDCVRVFSRHHYDALEKLGCECYRGDIRDAHAVARACADIDTVFHVAALAGYWGNPQIYHSINVGGTLNALEGCRRHGVSRLIYTSSPSVVFGSESLNGVNETQPYPRRYLAHYPETKAKAERLVLAANGDDGLLTCALRPHLIWGPRDTHIVPLIAKRAAEGKLVRIGDGRNTVDITYVEHAAHAHLLAADALLPDSPVGGRAYFIGDSEPVGLWGWIDALLEALELPPVSKSVSYRSAYNLGAAAEWIYRLLPLPGQPRITRFVANSFALSHYFDHSRARNDFGYAPTVGVSEGLRRTAAWYLAGDIA